ncbi:MAG: molybdate ABC transporter substrate-binding protein [Terriglobia bacterium]
MTPSRRASQRLFVPAIILLAAAVSAASGLPAASGAGRINLTVSAAVSLTESLQTLRSLYQRQHLGVSIALNLGASGILQQQIEEGAPADIFISASPEEMNALQKKDLLLMGTRRDLLKNTLVLICPANEHDISGFRDLLKPRVKRVAIANPESVPAGMYAKQTLEYFKVYRQIQSKVIRAEDVRQALAYVETGNVDAGIVYMTEAKLSAKVRVVATAPDDSHAPIVYPVAVLERSRHAEAAEDFVRFLMTGEAQRVFAHEGFESTAHY